MQCPKCNAEMAVQKIDDVEIDLCSECAGIFLDDGEFESFTGVDPATGMIRLSRFVKVLSKLNERAVIDELTQVYTRKYYTEFMQSAFANKKRGPIALIAIDIDFFKDINTEHGHDGGDIVLRETARVLTLGLRTSRDDHLFRLGGEEFCIVLFGLSREDSYYTAEMLRRLVGAQPMPLGDKTVNITLSMGVALAKPEDDPESLYKRADELLYKAKDTGRNQVVVDSE